MTFCANCADGLLLPKLVAELISAVVGVHGGCSLFDPSLKRFDANCDGLSSFGVSRQVKCFPVARCDPELPSPDEVDLVRPSEDAWQVKPSFDTLDVHYQ